MNVTGLKRTGKIEGLFTSKGLWRKLEWFFNQTLCCRPDNDGLWGFWFWWYSWTSRISFYFHCKTCSRCEWNLK